MFPGLSAPMQTAARQVMNGVRPNQNAFNARRKTFYSIKDVGSSGFDSKTFFDLGPTEFETNVLQPKQIVETDQFFVVHHVRTFFQVNGTNGVMVESGGNKPAAVAEAIRRYIMEAYLTIRINSRSMIDQDPLYLFPSGGGPNAAIAAATTNTASDEWGAIVNNGVPDSRNVFDLRPGFAILPGYTISAKVELAAAIAPPATSTIKLGVALDGVLVDPANR